MEEQGVERDTTNQILWAASTLYALHEVKEMVKASGELARYAVKRADVNDQSPIDLTEINLYVSRIDGGYANPDPGINEKGVGVH